MNILDLIVIVLPGSISLMGSNGVVRGPLDILSRRGSRRRWEICAGVVLIEVPDSQLRSW